MSANRLQIISIEVEDRPGVMTRISSLFSRRDFNIHSLSVGHTHEAGISRFTIVTEGDDKVLEQIRKQCQKLIHVLKTRDLKEQDSVLREFTIMKLQYDSEKFKHIYHLIDFYGGRLLDISGDTVIVEFSGSGEKIDRIYEELPAESVIESIRTGKVGMKKGQLAPKNK